MYAQIFQIAATFQNGENGQVVLLLVEMEQEQEPEMSGLATVLMRRQQSLRAAMLAHVHVRLTEESTNTMKSWTTSADTVNVNMEPCLAHQRITQLHGIQLVMKLATVMLKPMKRSV